eukprot:5437643-Prymnesium_polylepis.1
MRSVQRSPCGSRAVQRGSRNPSARMRLWRWRAAFDDPVCVWPLRPRLTAAAATPLRPVRSGVAPEALVLHTEGAHRAPQLPVRTDRRPHGSPRNRLRGARAPHKPMTLLRRPPSTPPPPPSPPPPPPPRVLPPPQDAMGRPTARPSAAPAQASLRDVCKLPAAASWA